MHKLKKFDIIVDFKFVWAEIKFVWAEIIFYGQIKFKSGSNHIISFNNKYKLWFGAFDSPLGLKNFTRCPNGINNAPSNFQKKLEELLDDLDDFVGLMIYIDDLLIGTKGQNCLSEMKLIQYVNLKQLRHQVLAGKCKRLSTVSMDDDGHEFMIILKVKRTIKGFFEDVTNKS